MKIFLKNLRKYSKKAFFDWMALKKILLKKYFGRSSKNSSEGPRKMFFKNQRWFVLQCSKKIKKTRLVVSRFSKIFLKKIVLKDLILEQNSFKGLNYCHEIS